MGLTKLIDIPNSTVNKIEVNNSIWKVNHDQEKDNSFSWVNVIKGNDLTILINLTKFNSQTRFN